MRPLVSARMSVRCAASLAPPPPPPCPPASPPLPPPHTPQVSGLPTEEQRSGLHGNFRDALHADEQWGREALRAADAAEKEAETSQWERIKQGRLRNSETGSLRPVLS